MGHLVNILVLTKSKVSFANIMKTKFFQNFSLFMKFLFGSIKIIDRMVIALSKKLTII